MPSGRLAMETVRVYSYGLMRLPATFVEGLVNSKQITLRWHRRTIYVSPIRQGELGRTLYFASGSRSPAISIRGILKMMGIQAQEVAGEYNALIKQGSLQVTLKKRGKQ